LDFGKRLEAIAWLPRRLFPGTSPGILFWRQFGYGGSGFGSEFSEVFAHRINAVGVSDFGRWAFVFAGSSRLRDSGTDAERLWDR